MRDQRSRRGSDGGLCGTGQTVRRFGRAMHFDRRRKCQRHLCSFGQHGTGAVRRPNGQLSWSGVAVSPVGQRWSGLGRLRARGAIRQRILDRTGGCLPSRVGTDFCRSLYGGGV